MSRWWWVLAALQAELAVWRGLARWVARRPDVPAGSVPVGYAQMVTPLMLLWIFVSAVEVPLVDVLLPWDALRLPLLAVGVWGLGWMLGLLGAYRTRPHLLHEDRWVLRGGLRVEVTVPLDAVAAVTTREEDLPGSIRSLVVRDDLLQVGLSGRTNVQLALRGPTRVVTQSGAVTVERIGVWVDDPRAVTGLLRERISSRRPGPLPR